MNYQQLSRLCLLRYMSIILNLLWRMRIDRKVSNLPDPREPEKYQLGKAYIHLVNEHQSKGLRSQVGRALR